MKEGFYWIQYDGKIQVALYVEQTAENLATGEMVVGAWDLVGDQFDIIHSEEVEVLSERLLPPI
ncbi:hypothetical protein LVQ79_10345 [Buttiauxella sp. A2-C1_F]|nr:hypothetical protein [Buttiauxella sp. A2-C1_F]MCE0845943.1 hypothetical protein [Buttiauxella sp. A2-C1_F]